MDLGLKGKSVLVTGGSKGIGLACAKAFAAEGCRLHLASRDKDRLAQAAKALGGDVRIHPADLRDAAALKKLAADCGDVDILVNNAGGVVGQTHHPIEDITDEAWSAVVAANLTSTFLCTRAVAPGMKRRGGGRIVNISSGAGRSVSLTGIQAYASSKAGQIGFTRQMAHELGPFGITVNCIAPGFVLSNPSTVKQWESYGEQGQAALVEGIAVRRLGTPEDIAHGVRFFVAEESSWITGQTISIDGGHALF
jgi:3-oxoacyl-[acyl-carrier protein] reductase